MYVNILKATFNLEAIYVSQISIPPEKLPLLFKSLHLPEVNGESIGAEILLPLVIVSPIIVLYVKSVEWTSKSFRDFLHSLSTWWNYYSWISVEMSNESLNETNDLSRVQSDDNLMAVEGIILAGML